MVKAASLDSASSPEPLELEDEDLGRLIEFFALLDKWDKARKEGNPVNTPTQSHREAVENGPKGCMKLIFCGTPEFAVPTLEAVIAAGHDVALVVTQPDRAAGRGMEMQAPPVKRAALAHGITSRPARKDQEQRRVPRSA